MPYKDPEKQREYKREWQRANRRGTLGNPQEPSGTGGTLIEVSARIQTPDQVLAVLEEQIDALRHDRRLRTVDRAKAIAQLATLCLKVIEARDLDRRVADVQSVVSMRPPVSAMRVREAA